MGDYTGVIRSAVEQFSRWQVPGWGRPGWSFYNLTGPKNLGPADYQMRPK
jgi:hypothetical protein